MAKSKMESWGNGLEDSDRQAQVTDPALGPRPSSGSSRRAYLVVFALFVVAVLVLAIMIQSGIMDQSHRQVLTCAVRRSHA